MTGTIPIDTRSLFQPLDRLLIELLKSLTKEEWHEQTVAKAWKVKDVASHLLDGNLRTLSIQRDRYFGEAHPKLDGYKDLVNWLNKLNADWTHATKRLSPEVLILLLEFTGPIVSDYYASLDPWAPAIFPVDWAGETASLNWMHVAREYTEKWHHQQQIRDAVNKDGILKREYYFPVLDTFFRALPRTFRQVQADTHTTIKVVITTDAGGAWFLTKTKDAWVLTTKEPTGVAATVTVPAAIAWKLFTKSVRPGEVHDQVVLEGDRALGLQVLEMVAVMA